MGVKRHNYPGMGNILNFNEIIKPYRSTGTKSHPIQMTIEGLSGALVNTNKIAPDIAGAVIFQTCYEIANKGLDFKGTGEYGSKWAEFFNYIRSECLKLQNVSASKKIAIKLMEKKVCAFDSCPSRTRVIPKRGKKYLLWLRLPRYNIIQSISVILPLVFLLIYQKDIILWLIGVLNDFV